MNESLKELAVRYFEGPIAPEEECELFGFLAASPENAALMRDGNANGSNGTCRRPTSSVRSPGSTEK